MTAISVSRTASVSGPTGIPEEAWQRSQVISRKSATAVSGHLRRFLACPRRDGWPIREVEQSVRLSETQRIAFFELVTTSLKTADTLASTCPADTAITPARRIELLRQRLAAVREATVAIRPALLRFLGALDEQQKIRFAGLS